MTGPFNVMRKWWHQGDAGALPTTAGFVVDAVPAAPQNPPPWISVLQAAGVPSSLVYPSTTLSRLLDQTADRFGDAVALVYQQRRWTYRELLQDVNRIAGGLAQLGVRQRDRVLLALPNSPEFVAAFFAIQKLGAVVVNVGPVMGADDLARTVAITTPQVAIGLDLRAPVLARAAGNSSSIRHWVWSSLEAYQRPLDRLGYRVKRWYGGNGFHGNASHTSLVELMNDAPSRPPTLEPEPDEIAILQPTGGTTGGLKLAQLSHRNLLANAMQVSACMACRPGQDRILALLPMFHVYSLTTCLICGVMSAAEMILLTRFNADKTLETIRQNSPTIFPIVPAICDALSDRIEALGLTEKPLSGLRLCFSGAAPLSKQTAERFSRLTGTTVVQGYGLTEAAPVTHANLPGNYRDESIGVPLPDTMARIAKPGEEDRDAEQGEAGELLVSGPQIMRGYFGDPEQNHGVLSTDAMGRTWLHTGDIATMDKDGFFRIVDRRKDMIIRSGMKVYPSKVEHVFETHPNIKEAAVFGRPDPMHTEKVIATVVLKKKPDDLAPLVRELRDFCREHLAAYEVPEEIEFIDSLPRSVLGKVLKKQLRNPPVPPTQPRKPGNSPGKEAA
ncbi:MAG: AMP-binding protein [Planctomycetota bacterium]|nr:AMP-binding protein [Planctomycetota bacterium]